MYLNIVVGAYMAVGIIISLSRFINVSAVQCITVINFMFMFLSSLVCFYEVVYLSETTVLYLFMWLNIGIININFNLLFDSLTIIMVVLILFISSLVHIYSFSYMKYDPFFNRFIAYLSLFTFFMLVLVTSNNFLQLLVG
jgi:NADH-ubiquinone oxidoreductase chain 5